SIAAFNASRLVCDEMRLMSSTKSSIDTLSSPSWLICFEVVWTTSRTLSSTVPAVATSPRCRSATVRISPPSFAAVRRIRHLARRRAKQLETGAHGGERGALLFRAPRDLDHGRRHLARGGSELLAHRRQV